MKDDEKRRFVLYTRSMWTDFANPRVLDQLIDANQILPKNAGELAKGKTATQSCGYKDSYPASKGVDGDITDQDFTHTCDDKKTGKWWQVDLGAAKTIVAVRIWSRMFYANLLKNFYVMISADGSTWTKFASYNSAGINEHEFLGKMTGRYVRIVNDDDGVMSVREVKVFGGDP